MKPKARYHTTFTEEQLNEKIETIKNDVRQLDKENVQVGKQINVLLTKKLSLQRKISDKNKYMNIFVRQLKELKNN